jgi:hypothetical protein
VTPVCRLSLSGSLVLAGGLKAVTRIGVMAAGVAVGVALLLGALGVSHAVEARSNRVYGATFSPRRGHWQPGTTVAYQGGTTFRGTYIDVTGLHGSPGSPLPPGLARLPKPGTAVVSPALVKLLGSPGTELLRERFGKVSSTIGAEGLAGPDELLAYVTLPRDVPTAGLPILDGQAPVTPARSGAWIFFAIALVAFAVPVGLFVIVAIRVSTTSRQQRLAALRLVGASRGQLRVLIALEALLAAGAGLVLGLLLFLAGRQVALQFSVAGDAWFPRDLLPSPVASALLVLVVPTLVVGVALVGFRKPSLAPIEVSRRTKGAPASARWLVPLLGGMAGLLAAEIAHDRLLDAAARWPSYLVGISLLTTLVGVIGTSSWATARLAAKVGDRSRGLALQLAGRHVQQEPQTAGRIAGILAIVIVTSSLLQALWMSDAAASPQAPAPTWIEQLPAHAILVADATKDLEVKLSSIQGVTGVRWTRQTPDFGRWGGKYRTAILQADSDPLTIERVRNSLGLFGLPVATLAHERSPSGLSEKLKALERGANALTYAIILLSGGALLVAAVDSAFRRRPLFGALRCLGGRLHTLNTSLAVEPALPLAVALLLGTAVSCLSTHTVLAIFQMPQVALWPLLGRFAGVMSLIVIATAAVVIPVARSGDETAALRPL